MRASVTDLVRTVKGNLNALDIHYKLALTVDTWSVCLDRYKDIGGLNIVLLGKVHNYGVGEQRGVIGAEGRVAGNNNASGTAELDKLLLRARASNNCSS